MAIDGRLSSSTIEVIAEYRGRRGSREDTQKIIDNLKLTTEIRGSTFYLKTESVRDWGWRDNGYIDLTISLPARLKLGINDGSGSMTVSGIDGDVTIEDGSGDIEVNGLKGNLKIDDGSGSIRIENVAKNVSIRDGSGSINIRHVGGDVWIASGPAVGFWPVSPDRKWFAFMGRGVSIAHLDGTHRRLVTRKICCFFGSVAIEWAGK